MAATRQALRALRDGNLLGIFPEGRLEPTRELLPFHPGAALLAVKTGAAVYPAYIDGTHRADNIVAAVTRPGEARLTFGQPIEFRGEVREKRSAANAMAEIHDAVQSLRCANLPIQR